MRRGWRLKQIIRLGSWLEGLRTWLAWEKNWISDRNPWHPSSKPGSWWFDDIQWHMSSLVGQLSPAKKFEIVGQEAVKSHLTIINTFRSGKPRIKGMERCRFCLSRSVLPTGERHHAQSDTTDGKNCAGKIPEFCHHFFGREKRRESPC